MGVAGPEGLCQANNARRATPRRSPAANPAAVERAVAASLDLSEESRRQYEEDAGAIGFDRLADSRLDQLRLRLAAALVMCGPGSGNI